MAVRIYDVEPVSRRLVGLQHVVSGSFGFDYRRIVLSGNERHHGGNRRDVAQIIVGRHSGIVLFGELESGKLAGNGFSQLLVAALYLFGLDPLRHGAGNQCCERLFLVRDQHLVAVGFDVVAVRRDVPRIGGGIGADVHGEPLGCVRSGFAAVCKSAERIEPGAEVCRCLVFVGTSYEALLQHVDGESGASVIRDQECRHAGDHRAGHGCALVRCIFVVGDGAEDAGAEFEVSARRTDVYPIAIIGIVGALII